MQEACLLLMVLEMLAIMSVAITSYVNTDTQFLKLEKTILYIQI